MLTGLSLLSDGRWAIKSTVVVYFQFEDVCPKTLCPWSKLLSFRVHKLCQRVIWPNRQRRQMCTRLQRRWICSSYFQRTHPEYWTYHSVHWSSRLKLSMDKCSFGQCKVEFLGKTISSQGISLFEHEIDSFLRNSNPPITSKYLQHYIGFVSFHRQYIPNPAEKFIPLHQLF